MPIHNAPHFLLGPELDEADAFRMLPEVQQFFVAEWCRSFDYESACRAGGLNPRNSRNLLNRPVIKKAIKEYLSCMPITPQEVIASVVEIKRADIADFLKITLDEDGHEHIEFDLITAVKMHKTGTIKEIEIDKRGKVRVKMYDRFEADKLLGKYFGLFPDTVETRDTTDWKQIARASGLNQADVEKEARRLLGMGETMPIIDGVAIVEKDDTLHTQE